MFAAGRDIGERRRALRRRRHTPTPARTIDKPGGTIVVTAADARRAAGTPITIVGHATVDGKPLDSNLEIVTLKAGGDARVDLCVPTLTRQRRRGHVLADGASTGTVNATINKCDDTQQPLGVAAGRLHDPPRGRCQPDVRVALGARSATPTPTATRP